MTRRRKIFLGTAVFLVLCFLIFGLGLIVPFSVILTLLFGWFRFIRDVVFTAEINWRELSFFVLVTFVFAGVLHSFCRWLYRHTCEDSSQWKVSWSASITSLIFLFFVTTMSTVGIAHQAAWIPQRPFTKNSWEGLQLKRNCEKTIAQIEDGVGRDSVLAELQTEVSKLGQKRSRDYSISVIPSKQRKADGLLVMYNSSVNKRSQSPVAYCHFDRNLPTRMIKLHQVPQLLRLISQGDHAALKVLSD
ncbi:MAG: hypothetical protein VYC39_02760 [Myxococcota bacterium]|nr:hypothetical protein [Myxococcota bacterium]